MLKRDVWGIPGRLYIFNLLPRAAHGSYSGDGFHIGMDFTQSGDGFHIGIKTKYETPTAKQTKKWEASLQNGRMMHALKWIESEDHTWFYK